MSITNGYKICPQLVKQIQICLPFRMEGVHPVLGENYIVLHKLLLCWCKHTMVQFAMVTN